MKKQKTESGRPIIRCAHVREVPIGDLIANPRNPNRHPAEQVALLAKNISELGWRHPILVSKRSGYIVAGHARLEAAKLLKCQTVPVDLQDFRDDAEELAYVIADNRIAELSDIDQVAIKDLLEEIDTGGIDMALTGYSAAALEDMMTACVPESNEGGNENGQIECPKCHHRWANG
jgi:ParB-like chromosome segregation protein Spo0J